MTINNNYKQIIIMIMIVTMTINNKDNYIQIIIKEKKRNDLQVKRINWQQRSMCWEGKQNRRSFQREPSPTTLPLAFLYQSTVLTPKFPFTNTSSTTHHPSTPPADPSPNHKIKTHPSINSNTYKSTLHRTLLNPTSP